MHIKIETLMWLLPIAFMFHDFEEIMKTWISRNSGVLAARYPRLVMRLVAQHDDLSQPAFSFAVAEEFVVFSILTFITVEYNLYAAWTGIMLAFFAHLLVHLAQFVVFRKCVPVLITSVLSSAYCLLALAQMRTSIGLAWKDIAPWAGLAFVLLAVNLIFALKLAKLFNRWLDKHYTGQPFPG